MPFYEVPRVSSFAKLLAIFCSHTRKGNLLAFQTAPPRRPVLTQVLLISQLRQSYNHYMTQPFVYVKTTYPTGNIRLIISSPLRALATDGQ